MLCEIQFTSLWQQAVNSAVTVEAIWQKKLQSKYTYYDWKN